MSKIVWSFDIRPGVGIIDDSVDTGYYGGFLIAPKRFPSVITLRSPEHAAVIRKEAAEAAEYLTQFED